MAKEVLRNSGKLPAEAEAGEGELHLTSLSPSLWMSLAGEVPEAMTGAEFLAKYTHSDDATKVQHATGRGCLPFFSCSFLWWEMVAAGGP